MLHVVLLEPEIPANTGNIARTCAATGTRLHLIRPLGFDISEKAVRRAGLDYWPMVDLQVYDNLADFFRQNSVEQLWCLTTKAPRTYTQVRFSPDCYLLFGPETRGLPEDFLARRPETCLRLPMRAQARSLNLSNAVAITVYEALRQLDFPGLLREGKMSQTN
ncbi:MAG TPA: tRNA (cytidine(34)-2'-O)-methyltransferase [Candidatus Faecousia faecigallinarum]|nr:tRNA (cytidine(34)-2'-O)-methyltransferase [Candidatus Faecousia faecigallinarum]